MDTEPRAKATGRGQASATRFSTASPRTGAHCAVFHLLEPLRPRPVAFALGSGSAFSVVYTDGREPTPFFHSPLCVRLGLLGLGWVSRGASGGVLFGAGDEGGAGEVAGYVDGCAEHVEDAVDAQDEGDSGFDFVA